MFFIWGCWINYRKGKEAKVIFTARRHELKDHKGSQSGILALWFKIKTIDQLSSLELIAEQIGLQYWTEIHWLDLVKPKCLRSCRICGYLLWFNELYFLVHKTQILGSWEAKVILKLSPFLCVQAGVAELVKLHAANSVIRHGLRCP